LRLELREAKLGLTPVPGSLLRPFRSFEQPFAPTTDMPFVIEVPGLTVARNGVSVP